MRYKVMTLVRQRARFKLDLCYGDRLKRYLQNATSLTNTRCCDCQYIILLIL